MRRLRRALTGLVLCLLALVVLLASPVIYTETMCRGKARPQTEDAISDRTRPAIRTLLTYPEWHIVHAYDDYAEVIRLQDPHDFGYLRAVTGYWSSLCTLTRASAALGEIDTATRQLVHVIGVSFTVEMAMKALYEETVGRVAVWLRGPQHAPLDVLSAGQAAEYARFLQQVPWYRYDFGADAAALRAASGGSLRDRERAFALGLEHGARTAYARLIAQAVAAVGGDDPVLHMVVAGLPPAVLAAADGVTVLRETTEGIEVATPRYRALTLILADWAAQGADFVEISGNRQIMFTAISDSPEQAGALADLPRQGYGDTRHLFLLPVAGLAQSLRALDARGLRLEHVHDY